MEVEGPLKLGLGLSCTRDATGPGNRRAPFDGSRPVAELRAWELQPLRCRSN